MGQKQKILDYLAAADTPVSCFSVAKSLCFNPNSVRARLSELARAGSVERVAPGLYSINSSHGVGKPPRVQNFLAVAHPSPAVRESGCWEYRFTGPPGGAEGEVRLGLRFGRKRNKVTWTVRAPLGLDYYGLMFAYGLVRCVLEGRGLMVGEEP